MKKLLFSIVTILCCALQLSAQQNDFKPKLPDFIPPTPTAYELGKYGDIPVNESTGMANISIPLYTYSTPNLSIPLSMSYTTSGVKVDQVASWVGLGWNLNAGASISRTVRGMPDEDAQVREFISYSTLNGYKTSNSSLYYTHISRIAQKDYADYAPDIFNYSIDGFSGSFYFDSNWNAVFIKKENEVKVNLIGSTILSGFILTAPNGNKYRFGVYEESKQAMVCSSGNPGASFYKPTSWLLTKISHPFGDEINLTYGNTSNYFYTTSLTETYNKNYAPGKPAEATLPSEGITRCGNYSYVKGKILTQISSNRSVGSIVFSSTLSRADINDYKLDNITIKNPFNKQIKKFVLGYSQIQSSINYNGASSFPGTTGNDKKYRLFLDNITEYDTNNSSTNGKKHSFEYEDRTNLPRRLSFSQDLLGYYNGKSNGSSLPNTHGSGYNITRGDRSFDFNYAKKGILTKVIYPTKGYTSLEFESGPSAIRVKKIKSLSDVGATEKIVKYYYTSKENAVAGNTSTTQVPIGSDGFVVTKQAVVSYQYEVNGIIFTNHYYFDRDEFTANGTAPLYLTNANHFLYTTVTVGYGENFEGGGVEKKFTALTDTSSSNIHGSYILNGVKTNTGLLNGTNTQVNYFKVHNNSVLLQKKVDYSYTNSGVNDQTPDSFIGQIVFESPLGAYNTFNGNRGYDVGKIQTISKWRSMGQVTTTEYFSNGNFTTTQQSSYNTNHYAGLPNEITTTNSLSGVTNKVKYTYPTSGTLFNENRLEVLKTENYKNTAKTATSNNNYATKSGFFVPSIIQTSKGTAPLEDRIIFHSYDNKGNVTEISKKDGSRVVYIWGYNQTKPIAKIDNISYSQIQSSVANLQSLSNLDNDRTTGTAGTEGALRSALESLRASLPSTAMMTYFTYDPLIGVTSVTDARGRRTYYQYDSFGRLQIVKDHNGKILTQNQYNYKN